MDTTIALNLDVPASLTQPRQSFFTGSSPSNQEDSESIAHEEDQLKLSTVDWRWASRKGFWNPRRRCWNEDKGGMTAYLAQRNKCISQNLISGTKKIGIQAKIKKVAFSKAWGIAGDRMGQADRTPKIRWHGIRFTQISMSSSLDCDSGSCSPKLKANINESHLLENMTHNGLGHTVARRFWTYGYRPESVARIFNELPHNVLSKIRNALETLQEVFDANTQRILASDPSSNDVLCSTTPRQQPHDFGNHHYVLDIEDLLEEDDINGVVQVEFDPCTQERKSVMVNSRAALLMNLRKDVLVQLFDNYQVPLLMTDVDALRVFLVDLHCCFRDCTVHYLRRIVHKGTEVVGMLVCWTRVHIFSKAGQITKVRDCVRVVTASEYDYALRTLPDACPLAMMGDTRLGQELLDSAHADAQQTIWHLAHCKQGRKVLDQLIACTERLRLSLEHRHLVAQEGLYVHNREYHNHREPIIPETQKYHDENGDLWSIFTSFRFWNVGYQTPILQNLFNAIPHRLVSAIKKVSTFLKITHQRMVHHRTIISSGGLPTTGSNVHPDTKLESWMEEEAVWDEEKCRSYFRFEWCPTTNLRKYISLNHRCADCFNLTKDEVLTRIAHHNLPLISTEMDMLRSFLFNLFHEFDDEIVEYTRRMVVVDGIVHPSLVCVRSKQVFNEWGQVYQTKHSSLAITASEYDAALKHTPWACSLAVMGDRRSGSKLLSCAQSDARKTVASLAATRRGRSALARMARAVDRFVVGPDARLRDIKGTMHLA